MSDSVFEALFRQAVIDNFFEELDSLPPDEDLERTYTFSLAHESRMKKLFAKDVRVERLNIVFLWSKRVAAVVVITATILFGSLMFVPEVRAVVVETITEWYEKFVRFTSNKVEVEKTNHEPTYTPEGFYEELRESDELITTIIYANEEGIIILFESSRASGSLSLDNEERDYKVVQDGNITFHVFSASGEKTDNSIIWDFHDQRYQISSIIPVDEMFEIALSVGK